MKAKLFLSFLLAAALGGWQVAAAADVPAANASSPAAKKPIVQLGMNGAQLAQAYGRPAEVRPMQTDDPTVKAEQWFYRRKLGETRVQSAEGVVNRPAFSPTIGDTSRVVNVPEVAYRMKRVVTYQVTAVLLVNDEVSRARQWTEKTEEYVD